MKRDLAYWRELDARVKAKLAAWMGRPFPGMPSRGGEHWLTRQVTAILSFPFLLTPIVTWAIYPWLPQPEWWLYEAMGATLVGVSLVAHAEYKKANQRQGDVSEPPP